MNILTNHPGQKESITWDNNSKYVAVKGKSTMSTILNVIKLHQIKHNFDCIVLGAGRSDILFLLVNTLICRKKMKCVVIDCLWYKSKFALYNLIKNFIFKIADASVSKYVVWASSEIESYSKAFNLPKDKFVFIPYHHTINNLKIDSVFGDYLFSGGNFGRDYSTLIESVRGLPIQLLIASNRPEIFRGIDVPNNVTIKGYSHVEYLKVMAGCLINIVALAPNLLHAGGQQTFLNSMYFGKPTIVLDPDGAADYINDGVDGLLVPPEDPLALRRVIESLLNAPEKVYSIGARAKEKAINYSTEIHFQRIVELINNLD